jgi:hypothetical protein
MAHGYAAAGRHHENRCEKNSENAPVLAGRETFFQAEQPGTVGWCAPVNIAIAIVQLYVQL